MPTSKRKDLVCVEHYLKPGDLVISPFDQTKTDLAIVTHIEDNLARSVSICLFHDIEINLKNIKLRQLSFLRNKQQFSQDVIISPDET